MKKVKFGSYWKDNTGKKEHLKWLVLAEKDGKTLLLAKHGLDCRQYQYGTSCSITWENCDLRKWLHSTFINNAFSEEEQQSIVPTQNKTNDIETEDRVFLLSVEEANEYLTQKTGKCRPTPYARLNNAWNSNDNFCLWWLRSPGTYLNYAAYVNDGGDVRNRGYYVYSDLLAVRVAMWVDSSKMLESPHFKIKPTPQVGNI